MEPELDGGTVDREVPINSVGRSLWPGFPRRSTCIHYPSVEQQRHKTKVTMCIHVLILLWLGVAFSLTPPTLGFSRGASPASCIEMSPGHIRTHPQDRHGSHVTLYTSASSYLPGDLVTVSTPSTAHYLPPKSSSPHPEPSPVPRRSHSDPLTPHWPLRSPTPHPIPQNHSLGPRPNPKTRRHPRPPEREAKVPNTVPSQSAWELGILLVCASVLGMVLAGGLRYICSRYCNKHTGVTLNDRERDYDRDRSHGDGLIHVQECGDLVRVRRIRENSFVLLAEYNLLTPPGN
ncbi:hypothetical protein DPEC_G00106090 [Dallia pectoralis]|uniref:Uncharacterized protein n=1 Tax=Dallia pectoralis TaxID=75939 RepID=A0ACC2GY65_DALPE|nr:hypothetical protein DPEC_G00106090 [Dallia pectoralis]